MNNCTIVNDLTSLLEIENGNLQKPILNQDARKSIVIHLDINGTLILMDTATNKSAREGINEALAKRIITYWPEQNEPCSFFDYVYNTLVPGKINDKTKKTERDERVTHFEDFVKEHQLPFFEVMNKVIDIAVKKIEALNAEQKSIVPSFYHMITHLKDHDVNFSIQLRTFGKDLKKTKEEIENSTDIQFKNHINLENNDLYEKNDKGLLDFKNGEFEKFAASFTHHSTVQDYYGRWNTGGETGLYGKPFPVINTHEQTSIFFDDNAESPKEGKQVKVIVGPQDAATGKHLNIEELKTRGLIVKADALEALLDPNYFTNKVFSVMNSKAAT